MLPAHYSRYNNDWVEVGRLGKGGYGEVVKARQKFDGRIYAIKKVKQNSAAALSEVLSEVRLLSQLNHPYVVRYYAAWVENDPVSFIETDAETSSIADAEHESSPQDRPTIDFGHSTGGLDFVSSSGYPKIEFGNDSSDEHDNDASSVNDNSSEQSDSIQFEREYSNDATESSMPAELKKTVSTSRSLPPIKQTLYIHMEYCERHTLRDLIRKDLYDKPDEGWTLFRQVLEGLAHIHSHGIIHRDLKPDNIFIDVTNNPRIGDFGLATSGVHLSLDRTAIASGLSGDMTRSVGTTLYVAPEVGSHGGGTYNNKVDIFSLGIIFFEMCFPLKTAMERDQLLRLIRQKDHVLPDDFQAPNKAAQGKIILSLINHRPGERPSSAELLRDPNLPILRVKDETLLQAIHSLSDPTSPLHHQALSAAFSLGPNNRIKDVIFDGEVGDSIGLPVYDISLAALVEHRLSTIFRRHGALRVKRQTIFPRSDLYGNANIVQLLNASGTLVQLPYDLTLPYARMLAKSPPSAKATYTFGDVYREGKMGGAPRSNEEADFDITANDDVDLEMQEAEVIKVLDEIIDEFPSLNSSQMCFHINHADLLELLMDFCRIPKPQRPAVKEVVSRLNIQQWTWQRIRSELRSPTLDIPITSLDDLAKFDFRDTPVKAMARLKAIFEGTDYASRAGPVFEHLDKVLRYVKLFEVRRKIYVSPLSSFHEKFYHGGMLYQCLYDGKKRDVLAAGGRYDHLIAEYRTRMQTTVAGCRHAVGMTLSKDRLVATTAKYSKNLSKGTFLKKGEEDSAGTFPDRRCDILVAAFDPVVLRDAGLRLVVQLRKHNLSAELAGDARTPEELLARHRDDRHAWIIMIKHEASDSGKPDLRVRSMWRKVDDEYRNSEVHSSQLSNWLRGEVRERDEQEGKERSAGLPKMAASHQEERKANVQVLMAGHRSKKSNKWSVVEAGEFSIILSVSTHPLLTLKQLFLTLASFSISSSLHLSSQ